MNMKTNDMTLAIAFESVATKQRESGLTCQAFAEVAAETAYISSKLRVNAEQTFILATLLHHVGQTMETKDFADYAKVSPIRMMALQKDFDSLASRGLIVCEKMTSYNFWHQTFALSAGTIRAVIYNRKFTRAIYKDMTAQDVMDMIETQIHECDFGRIPYPLMAEMLKKLIADAQHVEFCRKVSGLGLRRESLVLFLIGVVRLVSKNEDSVTPSDYDDIIPNVHRRMMIYLFKCGNHPLCQLCLMEATDGDFDTYRLTTKAKQELLAEFGIHVDEEEQEEADDEESCGDDNSDAHGQDNEGDAHGAPTDEAPKAIVEKKLFYNAAEMEQIERLKMLLSQEKFGEVQGRMRAVGMRCGFTCLFYGAPGTGKSETVIQLARATGREIMQVNVASLRNMYVGESEKNTQKVFDDYKEKVAESALTPILLFNEADGIFGSRYRGVNDSVDQMENTIQNIILQNMETFEGILIATTNLTDNFDKAFERRFLFKICFEKPKAEVRKQIWMSVLPQLTPDHAAILASLYAFTGSMIENVARRLTIEEVLFGHPMTLDSMKRLCDEELIRKPISIKKRSL